ncbi:hypothetical protein [Pseudoroseomonas ludipueritiae]|uniref:Class I SAM-dependent methyltransferase n=1 Tax=Pseudoroseomonas ludipueritiae TaxID=198093 RepID=A0ABR7R2C4_9PROT|nr:hypothetical protein [Pseudoroseomonas ludipueritiae]MBC9175841.1 hypothetical protein [Pseudoroseomonas ludipueritiae]
MNGSESWIPSTVPAHDGKPKGDAALIHAPVPWLPPLRLGRSFLTSSFVVANTGACLASFSSFYWIGERCEVASPDARGLAQHSGEELLRLLASLGPHGQSPSVRLLREKAECLLLARRFTARVAGLPGLRLPAAAAAHRSRFLEAIDRGEPLSSAEVWRMVLDVPNCLAALGDALPGAEALVLIRRHAPIIEIGAGIGLWARCMGRADIEALATDKSRGAWIGRCGPVLRGCDARCALASPASKGRAVLMLWPVISEDGWLAEALESLRPGCVLLIGSPELDFVRDVDRRHGSGHALGSTLVQQARRVMQVLDQGFIALGDAALASATPDRLHTRLRAYRRISRQGL